MSKKKNKEPKDQEFDLEDDPLVSFEPTQLTTSQGKTFAVFEDEDGAFNALPVILFALGEFRTSGGDHGSMAVGMVSMHGGLEVAEHMEDMAFIGYWRQGMQTMEEFLEDHGIDVPDLPEEGDDGIGFDQEGQ